MSTSTFFGELLRLAKAEADARKSGDAEALKKAAAEHENYRQLCLKSDRMLLGVTRGALDR